MRHHLVFCSTDFALGNLTVMAMLMNSHSAPFSSSLSQSHLLVPRFSVWWAQPVHILGIGYIRCLLFAFSLHGVLLVAKVWFPQGASVSMRTPALSLAFCALL
jgi:hypothetical protein